MTNYEKWLKYTEGFVSPSSYIEFGFYYMVSAALQRRVWLGPIHSPIYPNVYVILVGEPSVGKGLIVKQVAHVLKYHKLMPPDQNKNVEVLHADDKAIMTELVKDDYEKAQKALAGMDGKHKDFEKPLLIPVASDATTYEALVRSLSRSLRHINYKKFDEKLNKETLGVYAHSSLCFCLEEISSLFRKRTEDTVHFLLQTYDCGDYEYDTKTQGKDRVRKCCLNFFGGTTPAFMQECFEDALLTEGFSSRTFFIFASSNRKTQFFVPPLTPEQEACRTSIIEHVEKLSRLYGPVILSPDTEQWLEDWWKKAQVERPNLSPKLNPYYGRKNLHVAKLGMAIHFAESTSMEIGRESFEKAIEILGREERNMHYALGFEKSNPLAVPSRKVVKYLEQCGRKTFKDLLAEFWDILPNRKSDMEEIIEHLLAMNKIKRVSDKHPLTGQDTTYYTIMRSENNGGNANT